VVAAVADTVLRSVLRRLDVAPSPPDGAPTLPGPEVIAHSPPVSRELVSDYVRHVGGEPRAYEGLVPAHLFPHWCLPALARTLRHLPYPPWRIVNGGCRLEIKATLPAGVPLAVKARLESVTDDGRRTVLRQRLTTGPESFDDAVTAEIFAVVARPGKGGGRPNKDRARVSGGARELARWRLAKDAGLGFAFLTGDFNPAHWSRGYARLMGFDGPILHGFATMARAMEGLHRALFAAAVDRIRSVDVRFTRPLRLPAEVGLYLEGSTFFVGDAPGGPAYVVGTFVDTFVDTFPGTGAGTFSELDGRP
jgi:hypothetical protein